MNNLSVTKSNNLIDASYKLSAQAQKLVLACLAKVDPREEIPKEVSLSAVEFSELMGVDIKNAHRELYKASDALWKAEIILFDNNHKIEIRWIQKRISKLNGEGKIILTWSEDVLRYISQLRSRFTSYKLKNIANLQSSHSIRLYELLMKFSSTGERIILLDDFKSALGIANKYAKFKDLNRDVIKPAAEELNLRSDITVKYETLKKGRLVTALSFQFTQNKQRKLKLSS